MDTSTSPKWSLESILKARLLWKEGYTSRQIGEMLEPKRTRNAVIGQLKRSGEFINNERRREPKEPEPPKSVGAMVVIDPNKPDCLCGTPGCPYNRIPPWKHCREHMPIRPNRRANQRDL